jgi:hypothetical protein
MEIRAHPPERARRSAGVSACCCCCCCCCCLHTIGGLIGAAVGGANAPSREERRTIGLYWSSFLAVAVVTIAAGALSGEMGLSVALLLCALPLGQLFTSLLVLLLAMVYPRPLDLPRLGAITWKSALWSVGGLAVMIGLGVLLT